MVAERRKLTYADYQAFLASPESGDRIYELIDGEIVEKMASYTPSYIAGWILTYLNMYLLQNPIGTTTMADGGYILSPDDTFIPDVGYISNERLPVKPEREVLVAPDFAVEVKSPSDSYVKLRRKALSYLEFGTKLVWLVWPDKQQVEVHSATNDTILTFGIDDILNGGDVLPGFTLAVREIFK